MQYLLFLLTVLILDLHTPKLPTFIDLLNQWPSWLSYTLSYLFIAVIWANHHYILRLASAVTPRLIWFNLTHLFSVSLLPLATSWMAVSNLSPQPIAFYTAVSSIINFTYLLLVWELSIHSKVHRVVSKARWKMLLRPILTLSLFCAATIIALSHPLIALTVCFFCLSAYFRPHTFNIAS
jgi:uncharacterized membrane protein